MFVVLNNNTQGSEAPEWIPFKARSNIRGLTVDANHETFRICENGIEKALIPITLDNSEFNIGNSRLNQVKQRLLRNKEISFRRKNPQTTTSEFRLQLMKAQWETAPSRKRTFSAYKEQGSRFYVYKEGESYTLDVEKDGPVLVSFKATAASIAKDLAKKFIFTEAAVKTLRHYGLKLHIDIPLGDSRANLTVEKSGTTTSISGGVKKDSSEIECKVDIEESTDSQGAVKHIVKRARAAGTYSGITANFEVRDNSSNSTPPKT